MNNNNIEHILVKYPQQDRGFLIPILQEVQQYQGYISSEVVNEIQDFTGVSAGEIFGVATFYSQFRFTQPGKHSIKICLGTACHVRQAPLILDAVERELCCKTGKILRKFW